jgi:hypothetical protein
MKPVLKVLAVLAVLWVANWVFLTFLSPSGVWIRRVVREHPLPHPIMVTAIDGLTLTAGDQRYTVAGVRAPSDTERLARLAEFIQVATAQGIEIESATALPNGHSIRCEPRVWHWCGNDPVAAHFEQQNLNELLIALGYAEIAPEIQTLATPAALRLRAADRYAHDFSLDSAGSGSRTSLKHGIDISAIMTVRSTISSYAYDMAEANQTK